jgi:hypothetical protein
MCAACKRAVGDAYYSVGKSVFCAACKQATEQRVLPTPSPALLARAVLFGLGGAIAGAAVYYAVLAATGLVIGYVAIAVGFLVGRAVQLGARNQRGRTFQIIAVVLTYLGIAAGYAPDVMKADLANPALIAFAYPIIHIVTGLPASLLTAFIVALGLVQAWRMNQAPARPIFHGPFRVGGGAPA